MTTDLDRFAALRDADLRALHIAGTCPDLRTLRGEMTGDVLTGVLSRPGVRSLRLWRGKVFDTGTGMRSDASAAGGQVRFGLNRLGVGYIEVRRYRFVARVAMSLFTDRPVVVLDHDGHDNPSFVRRFHDELVQIADDTYLATSHYRVPGVGLRLLCHFALQR